MVREYYTFAFGAFNAIVGDHQTQQDQTLNYFNLKYIVEWMNEYT